MYIRFTITAVDADSHQTQGLFVKSYQLLDEGNLSAEEGDELRALLDWFKKNLLAPANSVLRNQNRKGRAVFWFRAGATKHIERMWQLVNVLRSHDVAVEVKTCSYFGNIAYRDRHQVAIYPHQRDGAILTK